MTGGCWRDRRKVVLVIWLWLVLVSAAFGGLLAWGASIANRVEDESAGVGDGGERAPYGSKWLAILSGRDR